MIEDPPKLTLKRNKNRPSQAQLDKLKGTPTGFVVDCMNGRGALPYDVKPLDPMNSRVIGVALTSSNGPDDNLGLIGAVYIAEAGDFILAATESFRQSAVTGDLVLGMARNKGVVGFATDGLIRDTEGCRKVNIPTFSRGVSPNSPVKNGPGSAGLPIVLGSVVVESGDVIVSDEDGVVVIPRLQIDTVIARLEDVRVAEAKMDRAVFEDGLDEPTFLKDFIDRGEVLEL